MSTWKRTVDCGALRAENVGSEIQLNGWAHRVRDFGDLVFIDLRDRTGLIQVIVDKADVPELVAVANGLKSEFVPAILGTVRNRRQGTDNTPPHAPSCSAIPKLRQWLSAGSCIMDAAFSEQIGASSLPKGCL